MAATVFTDSPLIDLFLLLGTILLALYVYFKYTYQYWKKKGVPYLEPTIPYGNNVYLLPTATTFAGESKIWYDQLKARGYKFGGVWSLTRKVLVLVDPDYIRDIMTQDFNHFIDRDVYSNDKDDPYGTNLFTIRSYGWKQLRQKLTPTFTSGKMKMMFNSVMECCNPMIDYIQKCAVNGDDFSSREVMASFTTDVIGSVAFGVESKSFSDTHAEFRKQGKKFFAANWKVWFKWFMAKNFPELSRQMRIKTGKDDIQGFFASMVKQTIEYRSKNNIERPDFLQLLINMNKENKNGEKPFSFDQIVANTILFFIAGFDTSSTVMNFSLYELARNPDIQEKTRQEMNKVLEKYGGEITYEALSEMTYLQQVMDESMRLYPPLTCLARICTKNYQLRDTNIIIEKGTPVVISTLGLGRDPDHFPDPERFDPERFSPEQKTKRHPYAHIPFGGGPRNCIGLRFGIMQSKIGLARILTNFRVSVSSKTKMPLTLNPTFFLLKENETLYLSAKKITNNIL